MRLCYAKGTRRLVPPKGQCMSQWCIPSRCFNCSTCSFNASGRTGLHCVQTIILAIASSPLGEYSVPTQTAPFSPGCSLFASPRSYESDRGVVFHLSCALPKPPATFLVSDIPANLTFCIPRSWTVIQQ
jgi:hypothetical protein